MNPLSGLSALASKPSDIKIRLIRIIFALLLTAIIVFGFFGTDVNVSIFDYRITDIPDQFDIYILAALGIFPVIGLIRGIFDPGLFQKSIWKKIITGLGIAMMLLSIFFLSEKKIEANSAITVEQIANANNDPYAMYRSVSTDNWLGFFGFITAFVGFFLNNKNLTRKNEKHGQIIKKIRV